MADLSEEEKKKQLLEEQLKIQRQISDLEHDRLGFSSSLIDSLKEVMGIKSRQTTFDQTTLKVNKQLHKAILDQKSDLTNIGGIEKDILKNKILIEKATKVEQSLQGSLSDIGKQKVANSVAQIQKGQSAAKQLQEELAKAEKGEKIDRNKVKSLQREIRIRDMLIERGVNRLSTMGKQSLYATVQLEEAKKMVEEEEKRLSIAKKIEKNLGVMGGLLAGMGALLSKIPGATKVFGDAASDAKEEMIEIYKNTKRVPGKLEGAAIAAKHLGKALIKAFTSPTAIFLFLVKQMLALDKAVVDMQRSMQMSKDEAIAFNQKLIDAAASSDTAYMSVQKMQKALGDIGAATGLFNDRSTDTYETFVRLTDGMGLAADEAGRLEMMSTSIGKDFEAQTMNAALTGVNLGRNNGLILKGADVLKETSKVSGQIRANLGNNTIAIAEAVVQAKILGTTLETVSKIGKSLLNFEQSISDEMEAELLIGRDLNLERARALALTGSQKELAEELVDEIGSFSDYMDLNVIQQQKLASAFGMSADEMSEMLALQEYQAETGRETFATAQEARELGLEELATQMESRDLTQKMGDLVERLSTLFMKLANGPLGTVAKMLSSMLESAGLVYGIMTAIAIIIGVNMVTALGRAIAQGAVYLNIASATAVAEMTAASALTLGIGAVAIIAGVALAYTAMKSMMADDMYMPPAGKSGYGKQMLVGPKGSISLNNNDTVVGLPGGEVIAGTDLFSGGNEVTSAGTGTSAINSPTVERVAPPALTADDIANAFSKLPQPPAPSVSVFQAATEIALFPGGGPGVA